MFKNPQPGELTVSQVAEKLGYTTQHVRLLIRQGELKAQKRRHSWFIKEADLKAFINSNTQ